MNKENVVKKVELVKEFMKAVFVMLFFAALFNLI